MSKPAGPRPNAGRRAFHRAALAALALPLVARAQASADSPHRALYTYQGAARRAPR